MADWNEEFEMGVLDVDRNGSGGPRRRGYAVSKAGGGGSSGSWPTLALGVLRPVGTPVCLLEPITRMVTNTLLQPQLKRLARATTFILAPNQSTHLTQLPSFHLYLGFSNYACSVPKELPQSL